MRITRRRIDFLQKIKQLYEATNLPVHYERVAELMGVSKWSAYEMLKILEKEGLLASQYEVNQREKFPGRAMVLFTPTQLAEAVLAGEAQKEQAGDREWHQTKQVLLSLCDKQKRKNAKALIEQLLAKLPRLENPLIFCAYMIVLLLMHIQNLSNNSIDMIKNVVLNAAKAETALVMFAGVALGSMLKTTAHLPLCSQLTSHLTRYQDNFAELDQAEKALLLDFLEEALKKAT